MLSITVVTAWHNHRELEKDYWDALRHSDAKVLVIDNGSDPKLPNGYRLPVNTGFCHANNVGLELSRTDAVLFLNNDIAATDYWLKPILDELEPGVLVGANLNYSPHADVDGERMPYLDGWCFAGMREDLLEIGGWDEALAEPAYFSDNILSFNARLAGMTLRETNVPLIHKLNRTAGPASDPQVQAASFANRDYYQTLVRNALTLA